MTATTARAHRPHLWTRDFVVSCLANICMFYNAHLFLATTAGYAAVRFGAGDAVGGAAASLFILGALAARVFAGPALERFGPKPLVYAAFALFVIFPPLYLPATSIGLLITERVLHGMALGLGSTAVATLAVSRIPHLRIGEGTGYYASSTVIGVALGPLLGLWLADGFGFQAVVWAAVATSAAGLACALLVRMPGTTQHDDGASIAATRTSAGNDAGAPTAATRTSARNDAGTSTTAGPPKPTGWHRLIQREAVPIALIGGLFTIGYATIVTFLSAYAEQRGLGAAASFFFLAYAVTVLATRPFTGRLLDVRGFNVVMVPGFVLFAAGLLLLSWADALPLLIVAAILVGLGQGNLLSATQTLAIVSSPRHRLAMATSTFFLGIDAGMGLGPILSGIVVTAIGPSATYGLLSVFMLLLLGAYWLAVGRKPGGGRRAAG